ncbi:glycosyltransferase family 4 protein [Marmoricola sp. RAF53]|uniref:glycosyltransferase family 4 protein n=1 Tax=Marmoricola sp. RAF53 TaxID=3233059 RepID=UPI003F9CDE8F
MDLHLLVPAAIDDPARPSGGNVYDRRAAAALTALGWTIHEHPVATGRLGTTLAGLPDGALVLVDGLLTVPPSVVGFPRLRVVVLVHLPWGYQRPGVRRDERDLLATAAGVVATSGWTRSWLLAEYDLDPELVHVAEPGTDPAPLATGSPDGTALLGIGPLVRGKGQDVLVAALAGLSALPWTCDLIGSPGIAPGFAAGVRAQVAESGLAGRVRLHPPVPRADLDARYAAADLLLVPSRVETYGMVVTEALARGIPVVASDVGGLPEALGRAPDGTLPGLLVAPEDPAALAAAVGGWLGDPELRARLRRAARGRRTGLTGWDRTAARLAEVLAHLGEPHPGALRSSG